MDLFEIIIILVVISFPALAIASALANQLARRRRQLALMDDSVGDTCLACDAAALVEEAPEAWCCRQCGYEQGPGWQRQRDAAHLEALLAMPPDEAAAHARKLLKDAHLLLQGADGSFEFPLLAKNEGTNNTQHVANPDLLDAVSDCRQAHQWMSEATMLDPALASSLRSTGFDPSEPFPNCDRLFESTDHMVIRSEATKLRIIERNWKSCLDQVGV